MNRFEPRFAFTMKKDMARFWVWRGLKRKHATPLWQPTIRKRIDGVTFLVHLRRGWDEVYVQRPGAKGFSIVHVSPHGAVDFLDNTLTVEFLMGVFDNLPKAGGSSSDKLPEDSSFLDHWPGIFELMTASVYPNGGGKREKSSLFVVCEEGQFKISISERTRDLSCWGVGPTFQAALDCLERRITSDSPEWRAKPKGGKGKRG